ncbi:MAG: amino acid ABC transporter substrate-binding protein, partial [Anaerolineaceae bacterium]
MNKKLGLLVAFLLFALMLVACGGGETVTETVEVEVTRIVEVEVPAEGGGAAEAVEFAGGGDTLAEVQSRGQLVCASNAAVPGFANLEADGTYTGFDYDYCRVVAAAVLGDSEAVEVRPTTATERFPVLQSGEADVLIRNTTWTLSRDTSLGFDFQPTTFYDGQGMMVRQDSGITTLADFEGGSVCVQAGTTTEKNLADVFRREGINAETIVFPDNPTTTAAYDEGRCDGLTTDKSGLAAVRTQTANPDEHVILDVTMSKEPLGPLTRHGDNNWG